MTSAIQLNELTKDFRTLRAVDHLSLNIEQGSIFGLLGPNGAGKTTTFHLLLGLLEPTSGTARVLDYDPATQSEQVRNSSGVLLEHHGLYERLSAEKNLEFSGRVFHMPKAERQARSHELLSHFNLWERRHEPVRRWSRGMKQRLAIARAIFHHPQLIFLDEPTAGLDPIIAHELREIIQGLAHDLGITILLNTHNLAEAEKLCTHIGVINQGRLLGTGRTQELLSTLKYTELTIIGSAFSAALIEQLQNDARVRTVLHSPSELTLTLTEHCPANDFLSMIIQAGGQIEEVRRPQANLEDIFISLVQGAEVTP